MKRSIFVPILATVVGVLAVLALKQVLFGTPTGYRVDAMFADAQGISSKARVEIRGIQAGLVSGVRLDRARHAAIVSIVLDRQAGPIGPGATATIRPASLLGEEFIDLSPGDTARPLRSGATIPLAGTATAVSINDVINTFQPTVRARLRILINEAGAALDGQGADFNSMLSALPPSLAQTGTLLHQIGADNQTLSAMITHSSNVIDSMTQSRAQLDNLITSAGQALSTVAARRAQLAATVGQAPRTLAQLTSTLSQLQSTAAQLSPTANELHAAAPALTTTLAALPGFAAAAQPTLRDIRSVAPALTRLGTQGVPPIKALRPTAQQLSTFSTAMAPNMTTLADGAMNSALNLTDGWARTITERDALGHVFRIQLVIDGDLLKGPLFNSLNPPKAPARHRAPAARHHALAKPGSHAAPAPAAAAAPSTPAASAPPAGGLAGALGAVGAGVHKIAGLLTGTSGSSSSNPPANGSQSNGLSRLLGYLLSP
jgi:phospholipid/cholesterol/gamma-HCH transport system substrate-binding protein